jgi:NAD(P)-dependent dehydrogenase (short-subunit alcohol dehydrogenase family)
MKHAIVTGHTSGLGQRIYQRLVDDGWSVEGWSLETGVNLASEVNVWSATENCQLGVDVVVNCAGVNYIDWLEEIPINEWDRLMNVNARAPWLVVRELINASRMKRPATVANIVSNASHMPMTHSAAYNASKGAAHILTLQMARELKKTHDITVFGISPNKLRGTGMSNYIEGRVCELRGWTPEEAAQYQLNALPAGEETDPDAVAEFLAFLLSTPERHKYLAGCILPYGA